MSMGQQGDAQTAVASTMAQLRAQIEAAQTLCSLLLPWLPSQSAGAADRCRDHLVDAHDEVQWPAKIYEHEAERGAEDEAA